MGILAACGAVAPTEPAEVPSSAAPLPAEVQSILDRARAGQPVTAMSTPVIDPEIEASWWPVKGVQPAVAYGNGVYLVVWIRPLDNSTTLYGVRVRASDGAVLDSTPISIGGAAAYHSDTAVAFDGNNFLVVWGRAGATSSSINAMRVRASDGALIDPYPFTISSTNGTNRSNGFPAVAFDGTRYLVAWTGATRSGSNSYAYGLMARWVGTDGQPLGASDFMVAPGSGLIPRVAYGSGRNLVTWSQGGSVLGVRLDAAAMSVLDTTPIAISPAGQGGYRPSAASNGAEFLVVWNGGADLIYGARVKGSDGAVLPGAGFQLGGPATFWSVATFDGHDYRVAWHDTGGGARSVRSARVASGGTLDADAQLTISSINGSTESFWSQPVGIAAAESGRFLVAYTQRDNTGFDRVKVRRVEDVQPDDSEEPEPCEMGTPTLVLNGSAELTLECGSAPYSDSGAQATDGCGNPIPVQGYNTGNDESGPGPNTSAVGSYNVSYVAMDAQGQTASALRTVTVEDSTAPALTLNGPAFVTHTCGSMWVDPGVQASDACYGNISAWVWRTGEVNSWGEGTYTVTYTVTDTQGNSAPVLTRTVEVVDCPW